MIRLSGFTGVNLLDGTFISSPELLKVQWKVMGGGLDCTPHTREMVSCFKAPTTWVDDPSLHTGASENSSGRVMDAKFKTCSLFFRLNRMTIVFQKEVWEALKKHFWEDESVITMYNVV